MVLISSIHHPVEDVVAKIYKDGSRPTMAKLRRFGYSTSHNPKYLFMIILSLNPIRTKLS